MKLVRGCFANMLSRSATSVSNGGYLEGGLARCGNSQLFPPLVVIIPRIKKCRRLSDMYQHGNFKLCAFLPDRVKLGIVHVHSFTVRILQVHSVVLKDLQSLRAISYVLFQTLCGSLSVSRRIQVVVA